MDINTFDTRSLSIASYLAQGSTPDTSRNMGFELEHFVVMKDTNAFVPYASDPITGILGIDEVLLRLSAFFDERIYEQHSDFSSSLIGLSRDLAAISLEPGAQLEISIGPSPSLADLEEQYLLFRKQIDPILDEMGYELVAFGYHPTARATEIPLIPKDRYHHMARYFEQTGKHGICMMRATAALQASVDFSSEADAVQKLRIAHALGPFFSFITDNTPVFEGVGVTKASTPQRMARMVTWDDCDPHRCLTPSVLFDDDFGFVSYAEALLQVPAVFTHASDCDATMYQGFAPFSQVLAHQALDRITIEHVLSLVFYDARLKRYIEIRQADSLPIAYSLAFVALIKGVFYNEDALEHYASRFAYLDPAAIAFAKTALRTDGFDAIVYQRPSTEWLDELITFAYAGLKADEHRYLQPLADLVKQRTTLLDLAIATPREI
ncbi:MAG: glutamate-cysteine ligase family protein [Coriobacteriia bacterium]|nr:glutamate-cysteine ligase family protein [Coriobacteriia bacterium]